MLAWFFITISFPDTPGKYLRHLHYLHLVNLSVNLGSFGGDIWLVVEIIPPPLLPESEFVFIETLFQSNVRPVVRLNHAFLVYGALERWKAMSPPEWCQVTQTRAVHRKRYSLDLKIQDMQASRTDHIVQVHVALAQSQILRPVGMGRHP